MKMDTFDLIYMSLILKHYESFYVPTFDVSMPKAKRYIEYAKKRVKFAIAKGAQVGINVDTILGYDATIVRSEINNVCKDKLMTYYLSTNTVHREMAFSYVDGKVSKYVIDRNRELNEIISRSSRKRQREDEFPQESNGQYRR